MLLGIAVIGALIGYLAFLNTTTTTHPTQEMIKNETYSYTRSLDQLTDVTKIRDYCREVWFRDDNDFQQWFSIHENRTTTELDFPVLSLMPEELQPSDHTTSVNAILDFLRNTPLEYCEWDDQETVFHPTVKTDQELVLDYLDKTNQFSFEKFGRKMFYENL